MAGTRGAYHCCVPLCTNDSRYDSKRELTFVKFPVDKKERKDWIIKIRRDVGKHFQITEATRVCSAHFKDDDFEKKLSGVRRRKPGVTPSIFAWTSEAPKRIGPQKPCLTSPSTSMQYATSSDPCPAYLESPQEGEVAPPIQVFSPPSEDHDYNNAPVSDSEKLQSALQEIERLNTELLAAKDRIFCLDRTAQDPALIRFYTGFKDYDHLKCLFTALKPTAQNMIRWTQMQRHGSNTDNIKATAFRDEALPLMDQFFLFLCRVRQGSNELDLAIRFGISQSSVSRIIITWANYLYCMLGSLPLWPPRAAIDDQMPDAFKETYPRTRVILDCTEIKVQTPSSKVLNSITYSNYKSHSTFKGLVGITPCGMVSFVSSLYTGAISDKEITARSGMVDLLQPGDQVMADKGFLIQDLLTPKDATLVIPPFLGQNSQFTESEVNSTHEIARLRIHVERAIRRMKEYHIFDGVIPLSLAPSINQIWTVCSVLTTLRGPLF